MKEIMTSLHLGAIAVLAAAIGGCRQSPHIQLASAEPLSAPTTVGTAPMFAVSPAGQRAVAWVSAPNGGTDGRLYVSVAGGTPTEIRDSLGPIEAHGEAPPKLAYGPDGSLYAIYTVGKVIPGERFPKSALRLVKSTDGGKAWTAPVTVTDGAVFGSHSFHALHVAANGTVYVSWLGKPDGDTSGAAMQMGGARADTAGDHAMMHEASAAWIARSVDGGRTWSPRVRVDQGEACPCCRTSVVTAKNGAMYMAWRHVYPGSVRDIVVARSLDDGTTWSAPVRVHADDWHFDACPHAGPAIALDSAGTLHVAWWTGKEGSAGVFYAQSKDGAKSFSAPIALGVAQYSRPAHVQMALASPMKVIVAWDDGTKQIPQVMVRVSENGGASFGDAVALSDPSRASTFPTLGVAGDSIAVAWSDESAGAAAAASQAATNARRSKAAQGLDAVGESRVLVRSGVLQ
jgi:hypothetical protein